MLTCIVSQFDCNEGTKELDFCISGERVKFAKPSINRIIGIKMDPTSVLLILNSKYKHSINNIQAKNIRDSYKLLNGKYPAIIHRHNNIKINNMFETMTLNLLNMDKNKLLLKNERFNQYVIIAISNSPKTIFAAECSIWSILIIIYYLNCNFFL